MKFTPLLIAVMLTSCNSYKESDETININAKFVYIDTLMFSDHNVFQVLADDNSTFNLLSDKSPKKPPFQHYEKIDTINTYNIRIREYQNKPKLHVRSMTGAVSYYIFGDLFWSEDSIFSKVYYSENIHSNYIQVID